jgi:hypothetical protein
MICNNSVHWEHFASFTKSEKELLSSHITYYKFMTVDNLKYISHSLCPRSFLSKQKTSTERQTKTQKVNTLERL